jgi:trehalose 6-phosphate synthase/phosphatase
MYNGNCDKPNEFEFSVNDKLVIISTRLPVSVSRVDGKLRFDSSAGGLSTAINSLKKSKDSVWVGWPGIASDDLTRSEKQQITVELQKRGCYPVFLTSEQVDQFYSGYSNSTLWPLFHYFPTRARYDETYWHTYQTVNKLFAKTALKFATTNAKIWVHDYQLMLVPQILRSAQKDAIIGFFLHTPFPSFEVFRLIPEREALLEGLLGANMIGFHTYDYVHYFLVSILKILGLENSLGTVKVGDRLVHTDAFPIGINYNRFARESKNRKVNAILKSFDLLKTKTKIILSVDRADYTKGIPERLDAFEQFLERHPQYLRKAVLVIIAVPSRGDVDEYQDLRAKIEQKVSRINGKFSTIEWSPITYRYQPVPFEELSALYTLADVMLVTPLRDGMNLVAKEYVASRGDRTGALVLSDMAGAAIELTDALLVNPNNTTQVADAIYQGLRMSRMQQRRRMKKMQSRVSEYTIEKWALDFMNELSASIKRKNLSVKSITEDQTEKLVHDYRHAEKRLILLDYDGTLKEFNNSPLARFSEPTTKLRKIIKVLTHDKNNNVVIISGRKKNALSSYFKNRNLGLIAEHGGWVFDVGRWVTLSANPKQWKKSIKPILKQFVARTPGSELEEKDFSLVWHYRRVQPNLAYVRKEALKIKLRNALQSDEIGVYEGQKTVEIKPKRMNKGAAVNELLRKKWDYILAIGDDYTDEDMFLALPSSAYTINVGMQDTNARFQLGGVDEVLQLIQTIIDDSEEQPS